MRILHVYKDFDPPVHGGMERHIALMCRYQRQWADVEALMCSRSWRTRSVERDGTRVTEVGEWGRFQSAPVAPSFPIHLRRAMADVIVAHMPNPTAELSILLSRPTAPLIVRYHSDVVRQAAAMRFYGPFQRRFLERSTMIIPTSDIYAQSSDTLRPFLEKCRVVPLGMVPEEFERPEDDRIQALHECYGDPFVLFTGRHRYYKGLEYLVQAAPDIQAPVVIAGEGPETARLKRLAEELNTPIHFPGRLAHEDLVAHLHACAVFVFPSIARSEAFGISIMEAHACGKPVVATTLGTGVEFINVDERTGLNVPPENPQALAEAVNTLLADPERRETMGTFARERVRSEFHAAHVARREFELYQEVVNGAPTES